MEILHRQASRNPGRACVFGSMARGDADDAGDVDLLVSLSPQRTGLSLGALLMEVQELLQRTRGGGDREELVSCPSGADPERGATAVKPGKDSDRVRLAHIRECIERIREYTGGDRAAFYENRRRPRPADRMPPSSENRKSPKQDCLSAAPRRRRLAPLSAPSADAERSCCPKWNPRKHRHPGGPGGSKAAHVARTDPETHCVLKDAVSLLRHSKKDEPRSASDVRTVRRAAGAGGVRCEDKWKAERRRELPAACAGSPDR